MGNKKNIISLKLNLGCGNRARIPGFTNIDILPGKNIDFRHDVRRLPMIHNNSVKLIYASHILEYFDREEVNRVLTEWKRVLQSGGILRLAVPDFEAITRLYVSGEYKLTDFLGPLYGKMSDGLNKSIYHKTVYDFRTLKKLLMVHSFVNIHRYDWKKTIHKDYDDWSQSYLPHMNKDNGTLISLNVEATKL